MNTLKYLGVVASVAFGLSLLAPAPAAMAAPPPHAADDSYSFLLGVEARVDSPGFLANDSDIDGLLGIRIVDPPKFGKLTTPPSGTPGVGRGGFFYVPSAARWTGQDSFSYCVFDADVCLTNVARVNLSVGEAKTAPDRFSTPAGTLLSVSASEFMANDETQRLSWAVTTGPAHGVLVNSLPSGQNGFRYTPDAGFVGTDTFDYCLSTGLGSPSDCVSESATVSIRVGGPSVERVAGADRYAGAALVAQRTHKATATAMYIASGENYADALSAGPVAAKEGAPLLLTRAGELPEATRAEIARLRPDRITVVGGTATISDAVVTQIKSAYPGATVTRVSGADRYEVSRKLALQSFTGVAHAFVATGTSFPDALSAGAAAANVAEPVVLVNGGAAGADAATIDASRKVGTASKSIVGGASSVSTGVADSLARVTAVNRLEGVDRYATSVAVNRANFTKDTGLAYLATGANYPDALVGSVIAGQSHAPLYVVPTTCVPQAVLDDFTRLKTTKVILLGGVTSLNQDVANLVPCP